jgi:predicted NUDIX family phosphoesterase
MEFVFVVPRRALFPDRYPQGFTRFGEEHPAARLRAAIERDGFFVERARAETEPEWKQIIPYNVVCVGDEVLLLRRTRGGGEARLHDKLSIGVGGHLNPEDLEPGGTSRDPVPRGTARELAEELAIEGPWTVESVGTINDDGNPVGAVHLGLVQVVRVEGTVEIRERHVLEGRTVRPAELTRRLREGANFETWSARLVEALPGLLTRSMQTPAPEPALAGALRRPFDGGEGGRAAGNGAGA